MSVPVEGADGSHPVVDTILTAAAIIPMDGPSHIISDGAIAIDHGRITALGPSADIARRYAGRRVIDVGFSAVLPGFIDVHAHLPQTLLRGRHRSAGSGASFLPFLITPLMTPADTRALGRVGCLEALRFGTTTVQASMNNMAALAEAVHETGLRAVLAEEICDFDYTAAARGQLIPAPGQSALQLQTAIHVADAWQGRAESRITTAIAPLAPDLVLPATYGAIREYSDRYGTLVATHLAQTTDERQRIHDAYRISPVAHLHNLGVLGPRLIAAHCVLASDHDTTMLHHTGTAIAHCPRGYLMDGLTAPLARWLAKGIRVGLGTDDVSHNMWETIRAARYGAAIRTAAGDPHITDYKLLELATRQGAEALGIQHMTGSLTPGKQADLQVIALRSPAHTPTADLLESLICSADTEITHTLVDGRIVHGSMRDASADLDTALHEAEASASRLWQVLRTRYPHDAGSPLLPGGPDLDEERSAKPGLYAPASEPSAYT
ncbi:hypothetical protein DMH18_26490 [Streptomyces sp. WAC 06783]|uniref:amidohydrolase family protein n=1 Tax=Streptomyces sp. WAC 06783 TaxID=2203211 RepID=UPI000F7451A8|nr:amidohydrolase family protein [Streptomyces sp. WAC 06783]RSO06994.1 hypothetical protein DMH18_26490 [Streptomyces sp. WAC 06783]